MLAKDFCKLCGLLYRGKSPEDHLKSCNAVIKLQCDECEYMGTKQSLRSHKISHHTKDKLKPFQCHLCTRGFTTRQHLQDHVNVHTGAKPHECSYCGAKFASNGNRNAHVRSAHKGIKRVTTKPSLATVAT